MVKKGTNKGINSLYYLVLTIQGSNYRNYYLYLIIYPYYIISILSLYQGLYSDIEIVNSISLYDNNII